MTQLIWDDTSTRFFETGVDRCVLYVMDQNGEYPVGIPWNGLTGVTETPSGAEPSPLYGDNMKYLTLVSAEDFTATLEAYTYPEEFDECDGSNEIMVDTGGRVSQQPRKKFGLVYRTKLGNDVAGDALGYKLHLLYGCLASPSEKAYATINDSPEAITFSWEISTTPINVTGFQPTSLITIDSTKCIPANLTALENQLFGATGITPNLPLPDGVKATLEVGGDWYVDSENGNDNNSGTTPLKSFATITKLLTVWSAGETIGVAKGSTFYETLTYPGNDSIAIAYGTGADPIIECRDVASALSFSKTGGRTFVYEIALSPDLGPFGSWNSIWEDEIRLVRVTSVANCDATPGSYFPSSDTVAPITMYVHASDDSNPGTNGKVYKYSKRLCSVEGYLYSRCGANGIVGIGSLSESGPFRTGPFTILYGCKAIFGNKHNFYHRRGSWLENCEAIDGYHTGGSWTLFVYNDDTPSGDGITYKNCIARHTSVALPIGSAGFYGHHNISGSFGLVHFDHCIVEKCQTAISGQDAEILCDYCEAISCDFSFAVVSTDIHTFNHCKMTSSSFSGRFVSMNVANATAVINSADVSLTGNAAIAVAIQANNPTITIDGFKFVGRSVGGWQEFLYCNGYTGGTVNITNGDFDSPYAYLIYDVAGPVITSDYNRFRQNAQVFKIASVDYGTVAAYQLATGQDAHSTIG